MYEFSPTGVFYDYTALAIGARSQSARTYLEKCVDEFENSKCFFKSFLFISIDSLDELIIHVLRALRDSLPTDATLTSQNCSYAFVSKNKNFTLVEDEASIQAYLDKLPPFVARTVAEPEATVPVEETMEDVPAPADGESGMDVDPSE